MHSQHRHHVSHDSTNICLTLCTAEQGGIGPEQFLTLHFELSEALVHWK